MPSIAQAPISPISGKKRRRDDEVASIEVQVKLSSSPRQYGHESGLLHERERQRLIPKRRLHDLKRQRIELVSQTHTRPDDHDILLSRQSSLSHTPWSSNHAGVEIEARGGSKGKIDLSPCHICHRKPTAKNELDSFADCGGCRERTCWICIRECAGLGLGSGTYQSDDEGGVEKFSFEFEYEDGGGVLVKGIEGLTEGDVNRGMKWERDRVAEHRRMVCSRCCVERGTEGEVWCLGCLRGEETG